MKPFTNLAIPLCCSLAFLPSPALAEVFYDRGAGRHGEVGRFAAGIETGTGAPPGPVGIRVGETVVFDGIEFVGIPPGEFLRGSISRYAEDNEQPPTRVRISHGFYLGKYEVTQDQWQAVMGNNPSGFSGCRGCPVEQVSWHDVQAFIGKLNARSGGRRYRLPTEAEWGFAARAGTTKDGCVATFKKRQESDGSGRPGAVSCSHPKQLVDELNLLPNIRTAHPSRLPLPDHVNCLISLDRSPRRVEFTKALLGFHGWFDRPMILLQDVVQVLDRPMAAMASQDSFLFHS